MEDGPKTVLVGFWVSLVLGLAGVVAGGWYLVEGSSSTGRAAASVQGGGFSSSRAGYSSGWGFFWLKEGETLVVRCEISDWKSGHLNIYVKGNPYWPVAKIAATHRAARPGATEFRFHPPKPGFYELEFSPMPDGRGYDFRYKAEWSVE
jgi:hypothetical protein